MQLVRSIKQDANFEILLNSISKFSKGTQKYLTVPWNNHVNCPTRTEKMYPCPRVRSACRGKLALTRGQTAAPYCLCWRSRSRGTAEGLVWPWKGRAGWRCSEILWGSAACYCTFCSTRRWRPTPGGVVARRLPSRTRPPGRTDRVGPGRCAGEIW